MKIYALGGLGADIRTFDSLNLKLPLQSISWIPHQKNDKLEDYAQKLIDQVDTAKPFVLIGLSFGGVMVQEIMRYINPEKAIIISSVTEQQQLPQLWMGLIRAGLLNLVPSFLMVPPKFLVHYKFSAKNKGLLNEIIDDTDLDFMRWSLKGLANWKRDKSVSKIIHIHGTADRLIRCPKANDILKITRGGHFMIVDKADEISSTINKILSEYD